MTRITIIAIALMFLSVATLAIGQDSVDILPNYGIMDDNPIIGDPMFVDPENGDFRLKEGSPAIDAGITIPSVTTDKDGIIRPQSAAYDIGAYEFVAQVTNTPTSTGLGIVTEEIQVIRSSRPVTVEEALGLLGEIARGLAVEYRDGSLFVPICITFPEGAEIVAQ